jgi:hypothetical protein
MSLGRGEKKAQKAALSETRAAVNANSAVTAAVKDLPSAIQAAILALVNAAGR